VVKISNGARVLYQWERGVKLTVTGQCDIVRMSREDDSGAKDCVPYKNGVEKEVEVPDFLLTESGYLRVSIIIRENDTERILETARFIIRPMQKSNNLAMSERDVGSWLVLKMRMDALERAAREGKFNGDDGITPHVGENGNWYLADFDTGVKATGDDGITPHIGENGNWYLGDIDTGVKALGEDGITPHIGENGNWFVGESDTDVPATGDDGVTPHIGENGNWYIGDTDTGIKASGIHIGTEPPTSGEKVWIDTDEDPEEENDGTQIDVIAQPGQIIAVKEVDANGKPTKWEAIDLPKAKEPETPDFSANEGEPGYIENRTHYVDEKGVIHKLPNMYIDAEWMATKEDGGAGKTVFIPEQTVAGGMWTNLQGMLTVGVVYAVEVNGILYRCECRNYDGTLYLGNGTLLGCTEHNNEPFCIAWMGSTAKSGQFYTDGTLDAPIGIKVSEWIDDIYNTLPAEFMPPVSWNNLTDRPVVDGAGEAFLTYTATFTTDTEAKNGAKLPNSLTNILLWLDVNGELVKVQRQQSGMVMEWYDEDGNKWVSSSLGGVYVYAQTAGTYTYTMYAPADTPMFDPQYLPPNIAKKADIPKSGGGSGGASIDVTAEVGQTIIVKEVDENGKPTKWESADYPLTVNEIIPQTTYTAVYNDSYSCYMNQFATNTKLKAGHKYTVLFDGVEYTFVAKTGTFSGMALTYIGNDVLFGNNTGEPFALASIFGNDGYIALMGFDGNEHTISLTDIKVADYYTHQEEYVYTIHVSKFGGHNEFDSYEYDESALPVALVRAAYDGIPLYMLITDNFGCAVKMPASFTMIGIASVVLGDLFANYTDFIPSTEVAALFPMLYARGLVDSTSVSDYIIRFMAGGD
jgi:hypothetical protein